MSQSTTPRIVPMHRPAEGNAPAPRRPKSSGGGNTAPVLVLRFEGQTQAALQRIEADMMALLRAVKPDAQIQEAAH